MFDELDEILDSVPGPFPASSLLSIRLRLLVPWQELLKQFYTPGCTVGQKKFDGIQDKLLLLHQGFFSNTSATQEFNDVLRMVQTHSVLSKLYDYFSKTEGLSDEQQAATNKVLDQSSADWESIYLESDGVPPSLLDLVDKTNGWDHEDRRDHILQIVSFPDSALTYKRLKKKMRSLLLFWFENEIVDPNGESDDVSELLQMRYRGFGYGAVPNDAAPIATTPGNTPAATQTDTEASVVVATPVAKETVEEKQQPLETEQEPREATKPSPKQQEPQQLRSTSKQDTFSSDSSDWSDSDDEEEVRPSMPVGEPSSPSQRKMTSHRKRRRLDGGYQNRRLPMHTHSKTKSTVSDWSDSDDSDSSGSDFDDSEDEGTPWTQEQDEALKNGIRWNGYGNWEMILQQEEDLLGSKDKKDLQNRANSLLSDL